MPRIFDSIDKQLLPTLKTTLSVSYGSDFCVGYFNLRGWRQLDEHIENWAGGEGECCRRLVGMQTLPQQEIAEAHGIIKHDAELDNQTALRLKKALAEQFRVQLTLGAPMRWGCVSLQHRFAARGSSSSFIFATPFMQSSICSSDTIR